MHRLLLLLALSLVAFAGTARAAPLTVFAAASLKDALDEAGAAYTRTTGTAVRTSYAATPALARQIGQGAPADVFIAADLEWMDALQRDGQVDAASRRVVAGNSLVLVARAAGRLGTIDLRDRASLTRVLGRDGRLALAVTATVPAGRYARASLTRLGSWEAVRPRVVETENVRAALQLVARGEAALGIVYASDARAEPRVRVVAALPAATHPRIQYPAARVQRSRHPQSAAFVRWLRGATAQAIFRRHGLRAP
ncbi:molybdate ABC transporter substrate-binding protein [Lysobacter humi (ex Lee et al. 2017)]